MKTQHNRIHLSRILLVITLLAVGFSVGCVGKLTVSPAVKGNANAQTTDQKDPVEVLDQYRTKNTRTGEVKRQSCQDDSDCPGTGAVCAEGKCYASGDACAQVKCGELERCEHGEGSFSNNVFCVPNCDEAYQCGGKCSAVEGQECVDYQWVTSCDDGRNHCATSEGAICCAEGTSCVGNACVPLGNECDPGNGIYCSSSRYCDPGTKRCIKYADNTGLCTYKQGEVFPAKVALEWSKGDGERRHAVYTTPLVADLDGDKIPEIIFLDQGVGTHYAAELIVTKSTPTSNDVRDYEELWTGMGDNYNNEYLYSDVVPAIADLDGDGKPEIVTLVNKYNGKDSLPLYYPQSIIKAFHADGSTYFQKPFPADQYHSDAGAIAIGDINHDGKPEIVTLGQVFDYKGDLLATLDFDKSKLPTSNHWDSLKNKQGSKYNLRSDVPILADVNLDGYLDIVDGLMVFLYKPEESTPTHFVFEQPTLTPDTTKKAERPYTVTGSPQPQGAVSAIANFNSKSSNYPQIVTFFNNKVYLADWRGNILSTADVPMPEVESESGKEESGATYGGEGTPTIADFDGDDEPEIGVTYNKGYAVYDVVHDDQGNPSLQLRWYFPTDREATEEITGSSVFDFDGDGSAEVVMVDAKYLYVLSDKGPRAADDPKKLDGYLYRKSNTNGAIWGASLEPVVADVDGDGHAEIVSSYKYGVRVFSGPTNNWVPTRPIWNQHAYSVTNIDTNGVVPREQKKNWQVSWLNNFRQNIQEGNPFLAPDLALKVDPIFNGVCDGHSADHIDVRFTLRNIGSAPVLAGKAPILLQATRGSSTPISETLFNKTDLQPNGSEQFTYRIPLNGETQLSGAPFDLELTVDPNETLKECDLKNNSVVLRGIQLSPPDAEVTLNVSSNLLNTCLANPGSVNIEITVRNNGGSPLPAGTKVQLYAVVGSGEEKKLGTVALANVLPGGASESLSYNWDNFPTENRNRLITLKAVVDEEEEITECNEENNRTEFPFVCQQLG